MAKIFGLLKELIASKTPKKVMVREEARHPITKNVNAISFVKMEKDKNIENNEVVNKNVIELSELNTIEPKEEEITGDGIEELVEMPRSQPIGYYFKHEINEKLIEALIGIVEDVLVEIAGYIYPIDFVILDVKEDNKKPYILRTPFLTTTNAEIRFDKGTITLKSGKNKINFLRIPKSLCRVKEGTENNIDLVAPTNTVSRLILEWEERIKLHKEKQMKFNQWRSKVFNDERSVLVNEGCEVSNEEGVT
ncbi:zinc finger, CCHC-type containing protein [Tanacetum coccineum]